MKQWTILLLTMILLLIGQQINGQKSHTCIQDTLVFQKKKNKNKQFSLPLNDYYVLLKPTNEKKKKIIITGYTDTTLIVKIYSFKKGEERKTKREKLAKTYTDSTLTYMQIDSLTKLVMYSIYDTISISQVDKIKIQNKNRKEMKLILSITEWSAVTWLLVGAPAIALFQSITYYATWNVLGIGIVTVSLITENKVINLDKWEILY